MRRNAGITAILTAVLAVAAALGLATPAAQAAVVPVDPGPIGSDRPIVGTGQNLPPMVTQVTYDIGDWPAPQVRDYYESGQARADQRAVSRAALTWVRSFVRDRCDGDARSCRAAVVFDIDETLLDNYTYYSGLTPAFTFDLPGYVAYSQACGQAANVPVVRLYERLLDMGVALVVLTGRPDTLRTATRDCLRQRGVTGWERLVLKSPTDTAAASRYKADVRADVRSDGYRIVASVGDQVSDMAYGNLKRGFLLPNPMYFIP